MVKDGEPVERHRIPPDGREVKSYGEVVIGTLLHTAGVHFFYEASFPLSAGKAGAAAGTTAAPEDLRDYRRDFYLGLFAGGDSPPFCKSSFASIGCPRYARSAFTSRTVTRGRQPAGAGPLRVPSMTDSLEVQVLYPA